MTKATIKGQPVDVEIIDTDGRSGTSLTQTERTLITALDNYVQKHPAFVGAYPAARLTRVDSDRILQDTDEGRFYLRYHHQHGDTELWGHLADTPILDLERGIAAIAGKPPTT
jgi:hypothetical protein